MASYGFSLFVCLIVLAANGNQEFQVTIENFKLLMSVLQLLGSFAACGYLLVKLRTKMNFHYEEYKKRILVQQLSILVFAGASIVDQVYQLKDIRDNQLSTGENISQSMSLLLQSPCVLVLIAARFPVTDYFHAFNRLQNVRYSNY